MAEENVQRYTLALREEDSERIDALADHFSFTSRSNAVRIAVQEAFDKYVKQGKSA